MVSDVTDETDGDQPTPGSKPKRRPKRDLANALDPHEPSGRRKNLGDQLLEADARRRVLDEPDAAAADGADGGDPARQWVEHLGPFYDVPAVRALLGGEGQPETAEAVCERKGLIALTTGSGEIAYPAVQFRGQEPVPGLERVVAELPEELVSRWTLASWLVSPERDLEGERPIDVLDQGPAGVDAVARVARAWAAQLDV